MFQVYNDRLYDRHNTPYQLAAEWRWDKANDRPMVKAYLRDNKRRIVAFCEVHGYLTDAIEWAKGEIAAMSRRDRW